MSPNNIPLETRGAVLRLADVVAQLPAADKEQYVEPFKHGTLAVGIYAPRGADLQGPHDRDEGYVVVKGTGYFRLGSRRLPFAPGDFLFVPAHLEHRFEDFTDDLTLWVVFYGPAGGEAP